MKRKFKKVNNILKHIANAWILLSITTLPAYTLYKIDKIEAKIKRPTIQYKADSVGGIGYVSVKDGNVITVPGYGQFLINDAESELIQVGDKVPSYILKRGN